MQAVEKLDNAGDISGLLAQHCSTAHRASSSKIDDIDNIAASQQGPGLGLLCAPHIDGPNTAIGGTVTEVQTPEGSGRKRLRFACADAAQGASACAEQQPDQKAPSAPGAAPPPAVRNQSSMPPEDTAEPTATAGGPRLTRARAQRSAAPGKQGAEHVIGSGTVELDALGMHGRLRVHKDGCAVQLAEDRIVNFRPATDSREAQASNRERADAATHSVLSWAWEALFADAEASEEPRR